MKRCLVWLFIFTLFPFAVAHASSLDNQTSLKVTIWMDGEEIEWEYTNPGEYEFEKGEKVIKGENAEKKVKGIYQVLDVTEKAKVEDMVKNLKNHGYAHLDGLDVRLINKEEALFTWVWHKNQ